MNDPEEHGRPVLMEDLYRHLRYTLGKDRGGEATAGDFFKSLCLAVRGICTQLGMDSNVCFRPELAIVEAVNNAIKHAAYDPCCKEELPEGGTGLHIIAQVMDEVGYCRREGRNRLTLRHRLRPSPII